MADDVKKTHLEKENHIKKTRQQQERRERFR